MSKRSLWIGGALVLGVLVIAGFWRALDSDQAFLETTNGATADRAVLKESTVRTVVIEPKDTGQVAGATVSDLLTDQTLSDAAVRSGLSKITLAVGRKDEDRNEALTHLLNLTVDEHESELLVLVRNPVFSPMLARRVFEDAFNRSHSFQADLCLELMKRQDSESLVLAAREHLVFLLGADVSGTSDTMMLKAAVVSAKKQWEAK